MEVFWVIPARGQDAAGISWAGPGRLLNIQQRTGQPPTTENHPPQMSRR